MPEIEAQFWLKKTLQEMNPDEWEALCDRCGKCCLLKLEDVDTGKIYTTDVGCKLLDCGKGCCSDYQNRKNIVPDCTQITPQNIHGLSWLPHSCAYKSLAENRPLPDWHPLITGEQDSATIYGQSVAGRIFPEMAIDDEDMADHIIEWADEGATQP